MSEPIWIPPAERVAASNLTRFARFASERRGAPTGDYDALWRWSVDEREQFWSALMQFAGVVQVMISYGSLMSQALQCTQLDALICSCWPPAPSSTIS